MLTEQELMSLKKDIEKTKTELSELKGENKALLKQLKDEHSCASVKEAEKKIQKLQDEIDELSLTIEEKTKELEETYLQDDDE